MSAARHDPLARWRAARAAQAAGTVAAVATASSVVATPGEARESAIVATVSAVATQNNDECVARCDRDAPAPMDHDAAERAAMAAHYAEPVAAHAYVPEARDPLRDGLARGFYDHRAAWEALPCGADRGRAFAEVRREAGACPICAGRRWWCETGEPDTALRCATCHPATHLRPVAVREVTT